MTIAVQLNTAQSSRSWTGSPTASQSGATAGIDRANSLEPEYRKLSNLIASSEDRPSEGAVESAVRFLPIIFDQSKRLCAWSPPHMTVSESGEVVFEWWRGFKKITLYFGEAAPEFLKVWGTDIETEMDSGELKEGWCLTSLLLWRDS